MMPLGWDSGQGSAYVSISLADFKMYLFTIIKHNSFFEFFLRILKPKGGLEELQHRYWARYTESLLIKSSTPRSNEAAVLGAYHPRRSSRAGPHMS